MAQILAPGVAQLSVSGLFGTQPWAVVTHWKFDNSTAPWTQQDIQMLADQASTNWSSHLAPMYFVSTHATLFQTVDLGTAAAAVGSNTTSVPGTRTGAAAGPSSTSIVLSKHIGVRYRGGHPRSYLPFGVSTDLLNEYEWTTTFCTAVQNAWIAFVSGIRTGIPPIAGSSVSEVVPKYVYTYTDDPVHHKYHRVRSGYDNAYIVQSYNCNPPIGTQRRRLTQG